MSVVLPEASGGFGDNPTLSFPESPAPATLESAVLVEGDGDEVAAGDLLHVNYHGQIWGGGIFDSSYARGESISFPIGVGSVIAGWDKTFVGAKVGSRIIVSIPPADGYGSRGIPQAGIGGTDTLVFVVDILGVN